MKKEKMGGQPWMKGWPAGAGRPTNEEWQRRKREWLEAEDQLKAVTPPITQKKKGEWGGARKGSGRKKGILTLVAGKPVRIPKPPVEVIYIAVKGDSAIRLKAMEKKARKEFAAKAIEFMADIAPSIRDKPAVEG